MDSAVQMIKVLPTLPVQVENQDYNTNNYTSTASDDQPFTNDEYERHNQLRMVVFLALTEDEIQK